MFVGRFDDGVEGRDDLRDFRFLLVIGRQLADGTQVAWPVQSRGFFLRTAHAQQHAMRAGVSDADECA